MFKLIKLVLLLSIIVYGTSNEISVANRAVKLSDDVLRGAHFKVYAFQYPPLMYAVKDSSGKVSAYEGFTVQFIKYLAQHFSLSLEYVPENPEEVRKVGQAAASLNSFQRKEVDFSAFPNPRKTRSVVDSTSVAFQESFILLSQYPEEESRLTTVARPFHSMMWIMFVVSTIALIMFITTLIFHYRKWRELFNLRLPENIFDSFLNTMINSAMHVLAILTQQSGDFRIGAIRFRLAFRIMMGLWLLMTIILINLYGSILTSFLTVTKLKPIPTSLEEVAANIGYQPCILTIQNNHSILETFKRSKYGPYQKIYEWMSQNSKFLANEYQEITDNIVDHGCSHIGTPISSKLRIANDFKNNNGKCRMTMSKSLGFDVLDVPFSLQKNGPYTDTVNQYLLQAISAGLMEYWKKWSTALNQDVCQLHNSPKSSKTQVKPIKLVEMSGAYLVLGGGLTLATFVYIVEKILWLSVIYSKKRVLIII